ncbi:MAG: nucleotide exchange factor GrpE, partial [Nitrospina sp.]|nr:nucleotide exchange factor GrpE [Nitrospina sp.]
MAKKKLKTKADPQEEPEINIVDRRSSILEEEEVEEAGEERLPTYVERLKQEAEEKDKRLR